MNRRSSSFNSRRSSPAPEGLRPDLNVVLPIKDPTISKQRLSGTLSPSQRRELSLALNKGVLSTVASLPNPPHLLVVTDSGAIEQLARTYGASVLKEDEACGETKAVERATQWSVRNSFRSQLVIPGDLAMVIPSELETLLGVPRADPSLMLCPATGDNGTNAVLTTPPNVVPYRFGERSFEEFREKARVRKIECKVLRFASFVLDLDTPEDLRTLCAGPTHCPARELLEDWNFAP